MSQPQLRKELRHLTLTTFLSPRKFPKSRVKLSSRVLDPAVVGMYCSSSSTSTIKPPTPLWGRSFTSSDRLYRTSFHDGSSHCLPVLVFKWSIVRTSPIWLGTIVSEVIVFPTVIAFAISSPTSRGGMRLSTIQCRHHAASLVSESEMSE
jgi:hypothetical protein